MIRSIEGMAVGMLQSRVVGSAVHKETNLPDASSTPKTGDVVNLSTPILLTNEEAQEALVTIEESVSASPTEALSVHRGLDLNRVLALLDGI